MLNGKSEGDLKSDENKLKVVALKTTSNINTLIKDLFHSPPATKAVTTLSWKTPSQEQVKFYYQSILKINRKILKLY